MPTSKRRCVDPPDDDPIPQSPPPGSPTSSTATLTSPPRTVSHSLAGAPTPHRAGSGPPPASQPPRTPAVPSRYPNLETHTQLARAVSRPKAFRRTKSRYEDCLWVMQKVFGKEAFRGRQQEIMEAAVRGADVLVVAPTGMGKSLCFQVPAVADQYGISIVISPLLSLMKNQIEGLRAKGVKVHMLCSETSFAEKLEIERDLASGHPHARLLYITPESLFTRGFTKSLGLVAKNNELRRLVVDEAHCISEWGSSFRPEYRKLGLFRQQFPLIPIMALTASATANVECDIIDSLRMDPQHLFRCVEPFNRTNLFYEVRYRPEPDPYRLNDISAFITSLHRNGPVAGIVYCRSRASCDAVSEFLSNNQIRSKPFHRGVKQAELDRTLQQWIEGQVDVVIATIAFGMGIDKPDVRYVVHFDLPKSFEGYYQETGRAGRDGHISKCLLYYSREDAVRLRRLVEMEKGRAVNAKKDKGKEGSDDDDVDIHRGVNSFKMVQHYAESTTLCRHIAICRYFGEKIDETSPEVAKLYCDKMCDVCRHPDKVQSRAAELSAEVVIASQAVPVTSKSRPRDEALRQPVNAASFYDAPDPWLASRTESPAQARKKGNKAVKEIDAATNPYLTSFAQAQRAPLRPSPLANVVARAQPMQKSPARARQRSPDPPAGERFAVNPYGQGGPSLGARMTGVATLGPRRGGSQMAFKTPFLTVAAPAAEARVKHKRPKLDQSSSMELELEGDQMQVELSMSQKIPASLRQNGVRSLAKGLVKVGSNQWAALVPDISRSDHQMTPTLKQAASKLELDIMTYSTTPDGYTARLDEYRHNLANSKLWQAVQSGHDAGDDEAGDVRQAIAAVKVALEKTAVS